MKKSKIIFTSIIALMLCLLCVTGNTFSWFSRPKTLEGKQLELSNKTYTSSVNDSLSFKTYESSDGVTYGTTEVTNFSEASGIASGARKYYRTDIYNKGANAQSVSLYLSGLDIPDTYSDHFYLGVNSPTKKYSSFTLADSSKVESIINQKHFYVGYNTANYFNLTNFQVHWWDVNNSNYNGDSHVKTLDVLNKISNYDGSNYNMTYAVIPWDASGVKLRNGDAWYGEDNKEIDKYNTICVNYTGDNITVQDKMSDFAAGLYSYYSSANVKVNESIDLSINPSKSRCKSVTYQSSNTSVATVSSGGTVKGISEGSATITVTLYGIYGDSISANCLVNVSNSELSFTDVPVVTNVRVEPSVIEYNDDYSPSVSIYWYIRNGSNDDGLTYTIPELYLTL